MESNFQRQQQETVETEVLLNCPFCGGNAAIWEDIRYKSHPSFVYHVWGVECQNTNCIMHQQQKFYPYEEAAILAWNKRVDQVATPDVKPNSYYDGFMKFIPRRVKALDERMELFKNSMYAPLWAKEKERLLSLMQELSIMVRGIISEDSTLQTAETPEDS